MLFLVFLKYENLFSSVVSEKIDALMMKISFNEALFLGGRGKWQAIF